MNVDVKNICEAADMIVCGYAFRRIENENISILQLDIPHHALVLSSNDEVLETTMDDIELDIVKGYWQKNKKYMQEAYA
ncbi:MAG: toxin-antitoxin system, toxin component [Prevotellaceae bacterium]|nr:toxin-antitoxin system, toxin component [Prevotellaceae bacterium]MDO4993075.1 toxin-antitoxin system, toxin component [Prevotellaceae bacterium]